MNDTTNNSGFLAIGTLLQGGKYRIDQYLASGGFGNTYIATNVILEQKVVIKEFFMRGITGRSNFGTMITITLRENVGVWDKMLNKFKREAQHLYTLNHQNIVRVYDFFEENDTAYYVMEQIHGESLKELVKREQRPLTEEEAYKIISQVFDALEYIHNHNLFHLDIKPANILIDETGTVKVIDFGASKQTSANEQLTTTNLSYTPKYAPPEQMMQMKSSIGPWSDIYSLGATWFFLLSGQAPPSSIDIEDAGRDAFKREGVNISEPMIDIIMQLMEPTRKNRPQSIAQVRQIIDFYRDDTNNVPQTQKIPEIPPIPGSAAPITPAAPVAPPPLIEPDVTAPQNTDEPQQPLPQQPEAAQPAQSIEDTLFIPNEEPKLPPIEEPQLPPIEEPQLPPIEEPQLPPIEEPQLPPIEEPQLPPIEEPQLPPIEEPQLPPIEEPQLPPIPEPQLQNAAFEPTTPNDKVVDVVDVIKPREEEPEEDAPTQLAPPPAQKPNIKGKKAKQEKKKDNQPQAAKDNGEFSFEVPKESRRQPMPAAGDKPKSKGSNKLPLLIGGIVAALLVIGTVVFFVMRGSGDEPAKPDTASQASVQASSAPQSVENETIVLEGDTCKYSGALDENKLPHGQGKAVFNTGHVYTGNFNHGKMDGQGVYEIPATDNGGAQKFDGIMKDGKFESGKYTYLNDGSYYEGTFKDETFYNGEYKDKAGNVLATFKDGKQL